MDRSSEEKGGKINPSPPKDSEIPTFEEFLEYVLATHFIGKLACFICNRIIIFVLRMF